MKIKVISGLVKRMLGAHSLAHDGDGFVSSVPLRVVQNLDHLE